MKKLTIRYFMSAALLAAPFSAQAATSVSGSYNGFTWQAQSRIVGVTSTATIAGGGSAAYLATAPKYSGVAALIMTYSNGNSFICSGSTTNGGASIVTAAHCVTPEAGATLLSTTAYFGGGTATNDFFNGPGTVSIQVANVLINPNYTGEVIDQNDIAVLNLKSLAPNSAQVYDLYTAGDLTGLNFNVAGYGARSDTGGSVGANLGAGRLRQGDNSFDFRLGDAALNGGLNFLSENGAQIAFSFLSDFDNGRAANDAACLIAADVGAAAGSFCNLGRGALEVSVGGGDSGGPQFIDGKLASVTSYGLSFGPEYGDIDGNLNSSYGEFNGFVPIYIHQAFIRRAFAAGVPESSTWMMMIAGFGIVGASMRRRTRVTSVTFG